ncbi:MAG: N-acyl homoserine lactone hydrolase [Cellvibrionaceae bacterium]|jgi:N-acyl homoserine lactone hydrolase
MITRLYILDFGLFQVHENGRIIGIPGYLIQTSDGRNILVDTGFHPKYAADAEAATLEDSLGTFGRVVTLTPDNLPIPQLAKIGLAPSDIDTLVMTHTDIDHVGGIDQFPQAKIVIHTAERAFERPRYWGNHAPIPWPDNEYQQIDTDQELCPGVQLISSCGHAPGHLSLLVTLPETGPVLLIGDAIGRPSELVDGFAGAWDEAIAQESADKLMAIAKQENAFIIYGHDPEQWPTLRKAPEFYG